MSANVACILSLENLDQVVGHGDVPSALDMNTFLLVTGGELEGYITSEAVPLTTVLLLIMPK